MTSIHDYFRIIEVISGKYRVQHKPDASDKWEFINGPYSKKKEAVEVLKVFWKKYLEKLAQEKEKFNNEEIVRILSPEEIESELQSP